MLDAAEALLFGGRDQHAVAKQRGRRIAVKGVKAKDYQTRQPSVRFSKMNT